MLIFGILVTIMVVIMLIGAILHTTLFTSKKNRIEPNSQLVSVEDGSMHVRSSSSIPRTSAQYMKEIRSALAKVGLSFPYVLMPHSISKYI